MKILNLISTYRGLITSVDSFVSYSSSRESLAEIADIAEAEFRRRIIKSYPDEADNMDEYLDSWCYTNNDGFEINLRWSSIVDY